MSGIFGLLYLDGRPLAPETLQAMQRAMSYWGPDGSRIWHHGPVGLGSHLLHSTPEAVHECLPCESTDGRWVITAEARVDNRTELFDALRIPVSDRARMPDSALILGAYRRWGEDCVHHLIGDWSFAIWDNQARKLFVARDHLGNTALYYYAGARFFAFASSLKAILALPDVPRRLNELKLAQVLTAWFADGCPTIYAEICTLPPAHRLTVTESGATPERYWRLEDVAEVHYKKHGDYVERLREVITEAVRCRVRSCRPVGTALSGGLDSGSVSALAARELRRSGQRLDAFSSVPIYDVRATQGNCVADETPFMTATAEHAGNIDLHFVRAEQTTPLDGMRRALDVRDMPVHGAGNTFWLIDLLRTAQAQGIGTLLTGQGGNGSISWPGFVHTQVADLIKRRQWRDATRRLVWNCAPAPMRARYRRWRAGPAPWEPYSAIHPDFAQRLNLGQQMSAAGHDPTFTYDRVPPCALRQSTVFLAGHFAGAGWAAYGAAYGIEVRDPTMDKRVLDYCLSVPNWAYRGPDNSGRWLIRRAMHDLLPPKVRDNPQIGKQAADLIQRLRTSANEIESILQQLDQSPVAQAYLSIERLREVWRRAQHQTDSQTLYATFTILTRGIHAGMFLLAF